MELENKSRTGYLTLHRLLRKEAIEPGQTRIGYVTGETSDNQPAALKHAATLLQQGIVDKIAIPDPLPPYDYGYPGPGYCKRILIESGVEENQITTISPSAHLPNMNTQTELIMVTEHFKKTEYVKNLVIVAPWFHILRSYITALSEFKNGGLDTKIFISSVPLNPYEEVRHSQGIQTGTRRRIFYEEIEKCFLYKNLIPIDKALEIYRERHNIDIQALINDTNA